MAKILAEKEIDAGFLTEAESLLRQLLGTEHEAWAQRWLAESYERAGRVGEAAVLVESLVASGQATPTDFARLARLLLREGDESRASLYYTEAKRQDPTFLDPALEQRLDPAASTPPPLPEHVDESGRERQLRGPSVSEESGAEEALREVPQASFEDVGGMAEVKKQVRMRIILPLEQPEMFKTYGKKAGGGILLYGPPGCGKTLFARATAGEINASFFNIGIHDVLDPYVGASEQKMHSIFETARAHRPAVLFFDEIDALASNRRDFSSTTGRQIINQFLSELDGLDTVNDDLLVLGATNAPWHLDPAFRRPGRFDRVLFVPPPDEEAREEILALHLRGKPAKDIDLKRLARKSKGFSGADLRAVIDRAVESKLEQALETGIPEPMTTKELARGLKEQAPTTGEWFASARNHALYANQGGIYDDVLAYMDRR